MRSYTNELQGIPTLTPAMFVLPLLAGRWVDKAHIMLATVYGHLKQVIFPNSKIFPSSYMTTFIMLFFFFSLQPNAGLVADSHVAT